MKKVIAALVLGLLIGSATTAMGDSSDSVQAVFAKFNFVVNGEKKEIKTTPLVVEGTSYLPVREVSGLLGYELEYDDATRTIELVNKNSSIGDEWVSLENLVKINGVEIQVSPAEMTLESSSKKFVIPFPNKTEGLQTVVYDNATITFNFINSTTYIKKSDLIRLGLIQ